jgi:hypothetical protein
MNGPGKYDHECEFLLKLLQARAIILAVVDGNRGSGFEVSTNDQKFERVLPALLREMADEIEKDLREKESEETSAAE